MHSNHCYSIKQPRSRFRPGTEDRQRGAMTRERLGVGRTSPRDSEVRGILQQPLQRGWRGGSHPVGFLAQGCVQRGRGGLK